MKSSFGFALFLTAIEAAYAMQFNQSIGQRRADAVMASIVEQGVASDRIAGVSYDDSRPATSNASSDTRATNRRVVFVYSISD